MGTKDTITKSYLKENHVFADVINCFVYQGESIVQEEQLKEMDANILTLPENIKLTKNAMQYDAQIRNIRREHYMKKEYGNSVEYLSGFHHEDRLKPVITLVLFMSPELWTVSRELSEMYTESDEILQKYAGKYTMNLIIPAEIPDEKIMQLQTNLREVLLIIKYSKDKDALQRIVQANTERMQRMERKAAMIVKEYTNWEFHEVEDTETMDVCQAVKDWAIEEQMIGEQRGRKVGKIEGVQQEKMETALKMLNEGFSVNMVVRITGLSVDEIEKLRKDQSHE